MFKSYIINDNAGIIEIRQFDELLITYLIFIYLGR